MVVCNKARITVVFLLRLLVYLSFATGCFCTKQLPVFDTNINNDNPGPSPALSVTTHTNLSGKRFDGNERSEVRHEIRSIPETTCSACIDVQASAITITERNNGSLFASVTVTNAAISNCKQTLGFASYTRYLGDNPATNFFNQTLLQSDSVTLNAGKSSTLVVLLPKNCTFQVDVYCGAAILYFNGSNGERYHGDSRFIAGGPDSEKLGNCSILLPIHATPIPFPIPHPSPTPSPRPTSNPAPHPHPSPFPISRQTPIPSLTPNPITIVPKPSSIPTFSPLSTSIPIPASAPIHAPLQLTTLHNPLPTSLRNLFSTPGIVLHPTPTPITPSNPVVALHPTPAPLTLHSISNPTFLSNIAVISPPNSAPTPIRNPILYPISRPTTIAAGTTTPSAKCYPKFP